MLNKTHAMTKKATPLIFKLSKKFQLPKKLKPSKRFQLPKTNTACNATKIAVLVLGLGVLTGCQQTKSLFGSSVGNVDYATAQKLPPVLLPADQQSDLFVPLYDVPTIATPTPDEIGHRYDLPRPPTSLSSSVR